MVTVGDELIHGERDDGNRRWLLARLAALGLPARLALSLPDDEAVIGEWLARLRDAGLRPILVAGGIGGTHDDRTREGVARALGRPLVLHPECDGLLAARFGARYNEQRRRMAMLPEGCRLIPNPDGAPGFALEGIHAFPGFPHMLQPMVESELERLFPEAGAGWEAEELELPLPEGEIAGAVETFVRDHPALRVGIYPSRRRPDGYRTLVRIRYRPPRPPEVEALRGLLLGIAR